MPSFDDDLFKSSPSAESAKASAPANAYTENASEESNAEEAKGAPNEEAQTVQITPPKIIATRFSGVVISPISVRFS